MFAFQKHKRLNTLRIMGNLFERLKYYFENTPKDVIYNDWREIEHLNKIGPDVIEYAEFVRENFGTVMPYSNFKEKEETHRYDVLVNAVERGVAADAKYCLAA